MNTLAAMPARFRAGSTVTYRKSFSDYPTADGWELKVHLRGKSKASATATVDSGEFVVTFTAAETAPLLPGLYQWLERVSLGDGDDVVVYDAASGTTTIAMDLEAADAGDAQANAEKAVELLWARIHTRVPEDMESYQIAGIAVGRMPIDVAKRLLADFKRELAQLRDPTGERRKRKVTFRPPGDAP